MELQQNTNSSANFRAVPNAKKTYCKNTQSGFAVIGALIFISLFGGLFIAFLQQTVFLKKWKQTQHECRLTLHQTQTLILQGFKKLMALNPEALKLRTEERLAQLEVLSAPDPITKAAAQTHLLSVQFRQQLFRQRQNLIIQYTKIKAQKSLASFPYTKGQLVPFTLEKSPPLSNSPNYMAPYNLKQRQKLEVKWTHLFQNKKLIGHCGATIVNQGQMQVQFLYPVASL